MTMFLDWIAKYVFKKMGWRFVGSFPRNIARCIIVVAPHTHWKEFLLIRVNNAVQPYKITLYFGPGQKKPKAWLLRGMPLIDHSMHLPNSEGLMNVFDPDEKLLLGVFPEPEVNKMFPWDTSFYQLAKTKRYPIVMLTFDYKNKWIKYHLPFKASIDQERDITFMKRFFYSPELLEK